MKAFRLIRNSTFFKFALLYYPHFPRVCRNIVLNTNAMTISATSNLFRPIFLAPHYLQSATFPVLRPPLTHSPECFAILCYCTTVHLIATFNKELGIHSVCLRHSHSRDVATHWPSYLLLPTPQVY